MTANTNFKSVYKIKEAMLRQRILSEFLIKLFNCKFINYNYSFIEVEGYKEI
jgi:hypothetical protein